MLLSALEEVLQLILPRLPHDYEKLPVVIIPTVVATDAPCTGAFCYL